MASFTLKQGKEKEKKKPPHKFSGKPLPAPVLARNPKADGRVFRGVLPSVTQAHQAGRLGCRKWQTSDRGCSASRQRRGCGPAASEPRELRKHLGDGQPPPSPYSSSLRKPQPLHPEGRQAGKSAEANSSPLKAVKEGNSAN